MKSAFEYVYLFGRFLEGSPLPFILTSCISYFILFVFTSSKYKIFVTGICLKDEWDLFTFRS